MLPVSVKADSATKLSQWQLNSGLATWSCPLPGSFPTESVWLANQLCKTMVGVTLKAKIISISPAAKLRRSLFLCNDNFETMLQI
jgi:hypothetical protein